MAAEQTTPVPAQPPADRKSTRLNSSHLVISYAVFCLKKKKPNLMSLSSASCSCFPRFCPLCRRAYVLFRLPWVRRHRPSSSVLPVRSAGHDSHLVTLL